MLSFGLAIGVAVAVVLCIGALIAVVLLGLRRYGWTTGSAQDEKADMEWDNSELNITVNPMDAEHAYEEDDIYVIDTNKRITTNDVIYRNEQSDCEEACHHDDGQVNDKQEEEPICKDAKELEWDDSVLAY